MTEASTGSETTEGTTEATTGETETTADGTETANETETPTTDGPTTDDPSETTDDPSETTDDPSETTDDPSETSETETGGDPGCGIADGDYGTCDAIIGWAFDGQECVLLSGCGCESDCDLFYETLDECATTCADAGECNPDKFIGAGIKENPFVQGDGCDEVDVCTPQSLHDAVMALFPGMFTCEGNGFPCEGDGKCTVQWQGEVDAELWKQLCAASLVPDLETIACVIWGP